MCSGGLLGPEHEGKLLFFETTVTIYQLTEGNNLIDLKLQEMTSNVLFHIP
jgi:hypothetical protein